MNPKLKAAYSFYGPRPENAEDVAKIACPVYGFYAENDERVNSTIPKAEELMKAAGKKYEPVIYKGAGHGFMRDGESPEGKPENKKGARRRLGALEDVAEAAVREGEPAIQSARLQLSSRGAQTTKDLAVAACVT